MGAEENFEILINSIFADGKWESRHNHFLTKENECTM